MNTKVIKNRTPIKDKAILEAFEHLVTIFGIGEHSFNTCSHHWVDENGDCAESIQLTHGNSVTVAVTTP